MLIPRQYRQGIVIVEGFHGFLLSIYVVSPTKQE